LNGNLMAYEWFKNGLTLVNNGMMMRGFLLDCNLWNSMGYYSLWLITVINGD